MIAEFYLKSKHPLPFSLEKSVIQLFDNPVKNFKSLVKELQPYEAVLRDSLGKLIHYSSREREVLLKVLQGNTCGYSSILKKR